MDDKTKEEARANFLDMDPQTQLMLKFLQDLNLSKYNRVFLKQVLNPPPFLIVFFFAFELGMRAQV